MTERVPYRPLPISLADVRYEYGPDSTVRPDVPAGTTIEGHWDSSRIYPGTSRRFWVHLPAGHDAAEPSPLMVFQDGWWNLDPAGAVRAAIVLDNLITAGDIPPVVGLFVHPGTGGSEHSNRNAEYDAFDERYVRLLAEEIIPLVAERCAISPDPGRRGIYGMSSGGNAALTAAWCRPDQFRRVICCLSSFAQMPGGNPFPDLIARVDRRPFACLPAGRPSRSEP